MLAIVIPFYKALFFEKTLESLANQTNKKFKVYIGNDNSPENIDDLLKKYNKRFGFVYHKFETNLGGNSLVKQWERCMKLIQTEEWIMILGDDDVLGENVVESFYNNLNEIESLKVKVIRFSTIVINQNNTEISPVFSHPKIESAVEFLQRKLFGETRSSLSEFIFNRETLNKVRFKDFPLAWFSDLLAIFEVSGHQSIFTINESIVYFRNSGENITSRKDNLAKKNQASFSFYYYLIEKYKSNFSADFLNFLFSKLEKTILDNKLEVIYWYKTLFLYIKNKKLVNFVSLFIRAIKSKI